MFNPQNRLRRAFARYSASRLWCAALAAMLPAVAAMTVLAKPPVKPGSANASAARVQARIAQPFAIGQKQKPADRKSRVFSERRRKQCDGEPKSENASVLCDLRIIDLQ
jgi:hypothetical protein